MHTRRTLPPVGGLTDKDETVANSPYQFSRWYELQGGDDLKGSCLRSPRIREGPANVTSGYASHSIMYCKKTLEWKDFKNSAEDWENATSINLSYQELGDAYQKSELLRCLKRLVHCTHLQLTDNYLSDISKVNLPNCIHLNLSRNSFLSLKHLPSAPKLQFLSLTDNHFTSIPSLSSKYPHLKSLHFKGNPTEYDTHRYRNRVFHCLPTLEYLDGYPKLPTDTPLLHSDSNSSTSSSTSTNSEKHSNMCTIS